MSITTKFTTVGGATALLLFIASCGGTAGTDTAATEPTAPVTTAVSPNTPAVTLPPTTAPSPTTTAPTQDKNTAASLAAIACDTAPTRMDAEAEMFTKESWTCTRDGERIRIDLYTDAAEMAAAEKLVSEVLGIPLADLPIASGDLWAIGADYNETRDAIIADLNAAGIVASIG